MTSLVKLFDREAAGKRAAAAALQQRPLPLPPRPLCVYSFCVPRQTGLQVMPLCGFDCVARARTLLQHAPRRHPPAATALVVFSLSFGARAGARRTTLQASSGLTGAGLPFYWGRAVRLGSSRQHAAPAHSHHRRGGGARATASVGARCLPAFLPFIQPVNMCNGNICNLSPNRGWPLTFKQNGSAHSPLISSATVQYCHPGRLVPGDQVPVPSCPSARACSGGHGAWCK